MIYPSSRAVVCTSELERKSKDVQYSEHTIEFKEMDAYACSHYCNVVFERFVLYESHFDQYNKFRRNYV
jgi:predicted metalloendopeptidase